MINAEVVIVGVLITLVKVVILVLLIIVIFLSILDTLSVVVIGFTVDIAAFLCMLSLTGYFCPNSICGRFDNFCHFG